MKVRLGDVGQIITGNTPKTSDVENYSSKDIAFIKPSDIQEDGLTILSGAGFYISEHAREKARILNRGCILVTCIGIVGKVAINSIECAFNQQINAIVPDAKKCDTKFIAYAIQNQQHRLQDIANAAVVPILNKTQFSNIEIPLPSLDEQRRIAAVLDKVSDLIAKRRAQLDKLDELVKARFVEMFGNPVSNTSGWNQAKLGKVTSKIGSGATPRGGKENYHSEGVSLIRSMNIHDGLFLYKDLAHITDEQARQLDNVAVEDKDVFINITGASVARSCIVPHEVLPARVNQHVAIIRCIRSQLNPIFASNMFINDEFKKQLLEIGESGGATRQAITKQQLHDLNIILPPLELQNKFATSVNEINQSKLTIQQSLDKLEILKKALMQEYFG